MYQNNVRLIGFLGDAPAQHTNHATVSLAAKTSWKAKDSDKWQHNTEWHRVIAWDKLAEAVRPLAKGDYVLIDGELRSSEYERDVQLHDGNVALVKQKTWQIRARSIRKLARNKTAESQPEKIAA